jgi:hypothetical protein
MKWSVTVAGVEKLIAPKNTDTKLHTSTQNGNVRSAKKNTRQKRILRVSDKQFRIAYKLEGVRVVDVWIPEDVSLPSDWQKMSFDQQDEWLYSFQEKSVTQYEDIHYSRAESVMAVRRLKSVDNG